MWKKISLMMVLILLVGCSRIDVNTENYDEVIEQVWKGEDSCVNEVSIGYQYYLPRSVQLLENNDYNQIFKVGNDKIYLYVDIVSYYYESDLSFSSRLDDSYYYSLLGDDGYVQIAKEDGLYYIEIVYNYAKIEVYSEKTNLVSNLINSLVIVKSIEYNETMIESLVKDNSASTSEIGYELDGPSNENSFSSYLEEYIVEDEEEKEE